MHHVVRDEAIAEIAELIIRGSVDSAREKIDAQLPYPISSGWLTICWHVRRYLERREAECRSVEREFSTHAQLWMRIIKVYGVGMQRPPVSVISLKDLGSYDEVYAAVLGGLRRHRPMSPRRESEITEITAFLAYWDEHPVISALDALEMYQAHLEANPPL
jgi:hypothetical protein